jgi:hypothetical protein
MHPWFWATLQILGSSAILRRSNEGLALKKSARRPCQFSEENLAFTREFDNEL